MDSEGGRPHSLAMSVAAFDTLKLARTLREKAKLSAEQAEDLAEVLSSTFATKADLRELERQLTEKIDAVRAEAAETEADLRREAAKIRGEVEASRYEGLRWIVVLIMVLQTAILFGLLIRGL
jgi:uncharacterized protein YlxW (UPF0749 family)